MPATFHRLSYIKIRMTVEPVLTLLPQPKTHCIHNTLAPEIAELATQHRQPRTLRAIIYLICSKMISDKQIRAVFACILPINR